MENASKALTMAGSVLIALMVIALFVAAYNTLSSNEKYKQTKVEIEQSTEFNKPFEAYNNDGLHGADVLSVANMIADYNKKYPDEGYDAINLKISLASGTYSGNTYFSTKDYNQTTVISTLKSAQNKLDQLLSKKYPNGKNIDYFVNMRSNLFESIKKKYSESVQHQFDDVETRASEYQALVNEISDFKTRRFKCKKIDYNDQNGRVKYMEFEQIL